MKFKFIIFCVALSIFSSCRVHNIVIGDNLILENDRLVAEMDEKIVEINRLYRQGGVDSASHQTQSKELNAMLNRAVIRQRNIRKYKVLSGDPLSRVEERRTLDELEKLFPSYDKSITQDVSLWSSLKLGNEKKQYSNLIMNQVGKKAYYDIGKYVIPYKLKEMALEVYKPMVDSIFMRAQQNLLQKVDVKIYIKGYADESPIVDSSELYNDLHFRMDRDDITYEEMKMYISYLRAYDIASIIETVISQKRQIYNGQKNLTIDIDREGLGLSKPDEKLQYKAVDERRRTVHVQWGFLGE